ncbi:MAG: MFS transporter [Caldilineaceae bacterium SB0661_bin_32]|uniref:MFS transporter n=1 Tax=Caldilineaceae bacterium SB0661_bin_32 TaxID=2605255 RepID=A0A6B1D636_9CHLR|nr:MFS transporter [Caldilineaceae bacterium SB0661_bin_32]
MRVPLAASKSAGSPALLKITLADFIVRSAYQMGKTPLLPIFAASLGASDALLGLIVSVSTLTGMATKPLFGLLSDRMGRRLWLLIGTLIFAGAPFLYALIETPGQLVAVRLLHGTATAIYGPVTVAYVAERSSKRKAERLGWFGMARSGGYLIGPAVAGWLLLSLDPVTVFTLIGALSMAAFVPVLWLGGDAPDFRVTPLLNASAGRERTVSKDLFLKAIRGFAKGEAALLRTPAVWLSGALEAAVFVVTYVIKAFLPIYALTAGYSTVEIGLFFSAQEGALILLKPWGGRLGDRTGHLRAVSLGMFCLALSLPFLPTAAGTFGLLAVAVAMGAAQGLIFPATVALIAEQVPAGETGAGMGLAGSLKNGGKVAGPLLGGLLIVGLGYGGMFWLLAGILLAGALALFFRFCIVDFAPLSGTQRAKS